MRVPNQRTRHTKRSAPGRTYTIILQPMPEGGYTVIVPAIPEICTFGETLAEARRMAKDAIRCFLESALKTGEPIPKDIQPAAERVEVSLPWSTSDVS